MTWVTGVFKAAAVLAAWAVGAQASAQTLVGSPPVGSVGPRLTLPRPGADDAFLNLTPQDLQQPDGAAGPLAFTAGRFKVDVTPHVDFSGGELAQAGATVRFGEKLEDKVADALGGVGVRDGEAFGGQGRWYVFAAASGRAVGMNLLRQQGDWSRAGWSTDATSKLVGDAQAGVAWRKGPMQASFGYVYREIKGKDHVMGLETREDSMVALSFSLKPK